MIDTLHKDTVLLSKYAEADWNRNSLSITPAADASLNHLVFPNAYSSRECPGTALLSFGYRNRTCVSN